jgi:hypothetical protein
VSKFGNLIKKIKIGAKEPPEWAKIVKKTPAASVLGDFDLQILGIYIIVRIRFLSGCSAVGSAYAWGA